MSNKPQTVSIQLSFYGMQIKMSNDQIRFIQEKQNKFWLEKYNNKTNEIRLRTCFVVLDAPPVDILPVYELLANPGKSMAIFSLSF